MVKDKFEFSMGDYIVDLSYDVSVDRYDHIDCDIEMEILSENLYKNPSDLNFVIDLSVYKIYKLYKGRFWTNEDVSGVFYPDVEEKNLTKIDYSSFNLKIFDKAKFEKIISANIPKFKKGDLIINPLLKYSDEQVLKNIRIPFEYSYFDQYRFPKQGVGYKNFSHLFVNRITSNVKFNVKYQKFLNYFSHTYNCTNTVDSLNVEFSITAEERYIMKYLNYNKIWEEINV